jgi:predicted PurR-regulated permease PerM
MQPPFLFIKMPVFTSLQRTLITWLLLVAAGWAFLLVFEYFREFITIFITAGLIAFLLSYPVLYLQKYLPRGSAILLVYTVAAAIVAVIGTVVVPLASQQGSQLVSSLPDLVKSGSKQLLLLQTWAKNLGLPFSTANILNDIGDRLRDQLQILTSPQSLEFVISTFSGFLNFILILVISFYMLLDGKRLWQSLVSFLPLRIRDRFSESLEANLRGFFTGQLILGLFMATILTPVYIFLAVPFAVILGIFVGLMELLPFIGATIGIATVVLICAISNLWLALWVLAISLVVQQIKDNIVAPRILGNLTGLDPVLIFGALLIGAKIAGLLGVLLAIPASGVIKALYETLTGADLEVHEPAALPEPELKKSW